jgi:hypothetical protein
VRYLACLVNLEGQLDVLPVPPPPIDKFLATELVFDVRMLSAQSAAAADTDRFVMGGATKIAGGDAAPARAVPAKPATPAAVKTTSAQWATTSAKVEHVAVSAAAEEAGRVVRDVMLEGFRTGVDLHVFLEPVYRFPVLAHWSFTVSGTGGFEPLMQSLDVGLLGTLPKPPVVPPGAPPPPPAPRPPAELAETGHVGLPHLTRRGEALRAWYRGPLASHPMKRDEPDEEGRLPFAHVSDQLRRVVPDGREDLSLAAAFEIGRLLALSQPSVVRALMAWRAEQFGAARAQELVSTVSERAGVVAPALTAKAPDLGALIGRRLVLAAAEEPAKVLAPSRPLVDPGRPLPFASEGGIEVLLAAGFGFSADEVIRKAQTLGAAVALQTTTVPVDEAPGTSGPLLDGPAVDRLRVGLNAAVDRLTEDALKGQPGPGAVGPGVREAAAPAPDALDELIARAEAKRGR